MLSVTDATIKGFNTFLEEQQALGGDAFLSLTLFDTSFTNRYVGVPLNQIPPMAIGGANAYSPGGATALLDAIGTTTKRAEEWIQQNHFTGQVQMVILTDGYENSSNSWHIRQPIQHDDDKDVLGLIQWKQNVDGWKFLFLGSGGTKWLENTFDSVVDKRHFYGYTHDAASTTQTYGAMSSATKTHRLAGGEFVMPKGDPNASGQK